MNDSFVRDMLVWVKGGIQAGIMGSISAVGHIFFGLAQLRPHGDGFKLSLGEIGSHRQR